MQSVVVDVKLIQSPSIFLFSFDKCSSPSITTSPIKENDSHPSSSHQNSIFPFMIIYMHHVITIIYCLLSFIFIYLFNLKCFFINTCTMTGLPFLYYGLHVVLGIDHLTVSALKEGYIMHVFLFLSIFN